MIEKNAFMVLKVSLLTACLRLSSDCSRDPAGIADSSSRKAGQLFMCAHHESLTVAPMRVSNEDHPLWNRWVRTQPQLQPALLGMSAGLSVDRFLAGVVKLRKSA
jgi:hypothetical protein